MSNPQDARPLPVVTLRGSAIDGIAGFHAEINRAFMAGEDWQLGDSLDALDDMLYGGYGALAGHAHPRVVWQDIAHSRQALGREATRRWLQAKLARPETFNVALITSQLEALEAGHGPTYFEIVMEIFAAHPRITLIPA